MGTNILDKAINICKKFGVTKLVLFGSAVENLSKARDLDLAVDGIRGWRIIELAAELENELNINVDVVRIEKDSKFIQHILSYGKVLYA